jgi:hypothetical protein
VIDLGLALHQIIEVPYPEQFYFKVKTPLQFACDSRRMKNKFTSKTVKFSMACSLRLPCSCESARRRRLQRHDLTLEGFVRGLAAEKEGGSQRHRLNQPPLTVFSREIGCQPVEVQEL